MSKKDIIKRGKQKLKGSGIKFIHPSQQQPLRLNVVQARKWNKLRYIEYIFRNMEINLHVNGVKNQDLAENFVK